MEPAHGRKRSLRWALASSSGSNTVGAERTHHSDDSRRACRNSLLKSSGCRAPKVAPPPPLVRTRSSRHLPPRRLQQVQRGAAAGSLADADPRLYKGMMDALVQIYRAGGVSSLFKGSGARMAYQAPSVAVAMATFENAKEAWRSLLQ